MMAARITALGNDLYQIDALMFDTPGRLACYFFDTAEPLLVECGPSVTSGHLIAALDEIGIDDVACIAVTHIHLDHAGASGHLAARYPNARIAVHRLGAPHLVDPTRLVSSATRIYGEAGMRSLWGPMVPIDEERLMVLEEGDVITLGRGREVDVMYTPGHAKHHVVFHEAATGGMFVGDAVGLCFPHGHFVQPATPPPDLDPPALVAQLRRMAVREPAFLGFAHFGVTDDPGRALAAAEARLDEWLVFVEGLSELDDEQAGFALRAHTLQRHRDEGATAAELDAYDQAAFWTMQVAGIRRWLRMRP